MAPSLEVMYSRAMRGALSLPTPISRTLSSSVRPSLMIRSALLRKSSFTNDTVGRADMPILPSLSVTLSPLMPGYFFRR